MSRALILTYHSISAGPPPLCLEPALLDEQLARIADAGATVLGVTELARLTRAHELPELAVALTFDDGYRDLADAVELLSARALPATAFCVAGWLGRTADWPTLPAAAPRLALADARELAGYAAAGIEIGAHGMDHAPLAGATRETLERELVGGRSTLEDALGVPVTSFAFPYGAVGGLELVRSTYEGACAGGMRALSERDDPWLLPRIDAHYLRRPERLTALLQGSRAYLTLRRAGARARRRFVRDYAA